MPSKFLRYNDPSLGSEELYLQEIRIQEGFVARLPVLEAVSRQMRDTDAASYRLKVGFAGVAIDSRGRFLPVLGGGNRKPNKHRQKVCAEDVYFARLKKFAEKGYIDSVSRVVGGMVFATGELEVVKSVSNIPAHALYNCEDNCVKGFVSRKIIKPNSHMVSMIAETREYESHTVAGVFRNYQNPPKKLEDVPKYHSSAKWGEVKDIFDELKKVELSQPLENRLAPHQIVQRALCHKSLRSYAVVE